MSRELMFICLGDSLTAGNPGFSGYGSWTGNLQSQFSYWLQYFAQNDFPGLSVHFENYGVGGDVINQMLERYLRDVLSQQDQVDYVLVMGGNNDVVWRPTTPEVALKDLETLFSTINTHGSKVIALEILPVNCNRDLVQKVLDTNAGIHLLGARMGFPVIKLYDLLADPTHLKLNPPYDCGDGEHLSMSGYRKVAEEIYSQCIKPLLSTIK